MTTRKIMMSRRPVNIHSRTVARHKHFKRAAGVSQGFGNNLVNKSFNHSASNYKKLPADLRVTLCLTSFKNKLRIWVRKNIGM